MFPQYKNSSNKYELKSFKKEQAQETTRGRNIFPPINFLSTIQRRHFLVKTWTYLHDLPDTYSIQFICNEKINYNNYCQAPIVHITFHTKAQILLYIDIRIHP